MRTFKEKPHKYFFTEERLSGKCIRLRMKSVVGYQRALEICYSLMPKYNKRNTKVYKTSAGFSVYPIVGGIVGDEPIKEVYISEVSGTVKVVEGKEGEGDETIPVGI